MILLAREEFEKYGYIYEPDASKCKTYKLKLYVPGPEILASDEWKKELLKEIPFLYVHEIKDTPNPYEGDPNFHADPKVLVVGHTRKHEEFLTPEEIESAGFIYEPDMSKCHMLKIRMHYDCNYYKDGKWEHRTTPEITPEWKEACKEAMVRDCYYYSHINKVFVQNVKPLGGQGVMCRWVMVDGHGDELSKKWYKTGLLEGLKPRQFPEAAKFLNKVAQEILEVTVRDKIVKDSPEEKRMDDLAGIILPVARMLFEKGNQPEPKWLVDDVSKFFDEHKGVYEALKTGIAQDHEREFQWLYLKHYDEEVEAV